jgi:glycosyltransferase involved in cell wall biosynthesis
VRVVHLATIDLSIRYLLLDQLRYLVAHGHDVRAICAPGPHVPAIESAGIPVHPVDFTRRYTPRKDSKALWRLARLLRRLRPDLVHTHTPKASLLGQYAALASGVPYRVHTIHGLYLPAGATGITRRAFLGMERVTMWPAHAVLSQSAEDITTCRRYGLCAPDRLRHLGNGIDVDRFTPPSFEQQAEARAALNISADHSVIGMVGRLVREKGLLEFFAAARVLVKHSPNTTFIVVGDRDTTKPDHELDSEIRRIKSEVPISFLGHRDDMRTVYWAMDLLLHPSHREGFPRVPMEASASGVPVVATDIRGCREAVRESVNGLLVPPRDPVALARAACHLLADPRARLALGSGGRELAKKNFDQRAVFARVQDTYAALAANRSPRRET